MTGFSFLCDPRGQLLGAQEESFLSRLFEARERNDLQQFGGHFPTDPELLRPIAYPHRPGPRSDFLQRLIAKLVQVRVATLIPPEPCQAFDLPPYLSLRNGQIITEESKATETRALPGGRALSAVIHNFDGLSPPSKDEIIAVAAAAADSLDLIARLKPFFPRHDVAEQLKLYRRHREKNKLQATNQGFAKWMLRAEVPIIRTASSALVPSVTSAVSPESQPELDFAERPDPRFVAEFEARKIRKAG